MTAPQRILMVCLGNICRSPVAHGVMEHVLAERLGAHHGIEVDSAGTSAFHQGEAPDPRSQASARQHGIDISHQASRPFSVADFDAFDMILVMDQSNKRNVLDLARDGADVAKVHLMLESSFPGQSREVPDPYYGGEHGFENVYHLIERASHQWIDLWH